MLNGNNCPSEVGHLHRTKAALQDTGILPRLPWEKLSPQAVTGPVLPSTNVKEQPHHPGPKYFLSYTSK